MPAGSNAKRERQYEHIKQSEKKQGKSEKRAKEIAARTVNKERARSGEAKTASRTSTKDTSSSRRGGQRSGTNRAKGRTRYKTMTLDAGEFMRRFLLHVLPHGFHRIRHYGLLANPVRRANLAKARELLDAAPAVTAPPDDTELAMGDYFDRAADLCGLPRPLRITRAQAKEQLSPMLLSFMSESRRLANARMKRELRLVLRYPTVDSGLLA